MQSCLVRRLKIGSLTTARFVYCFFGVFWWRQRDQFSIVFSMLRQYTRQLIQERPLTKKHTSHKCITSALVSAAIANNVSCVPDPNNSFTQVSIRNSQSQATAAVQERGTQPFGKEESRVIIITSNTDGLDVQAYTRGPNTTPEHTHNVFVHSTDAVKNFYGATEMGRPNVKSTVTKKALDEQVPIHIETLQADHESLKDAKEKFFGSSSRQGISVLTGGNSAVSMAHAFMPNPTEAHMCMEQNKVVPSVEATLNKSKMN
eukprot:Gregarina_sp_Poly_1__4108@NODE_2253_length_2401_cov_113_348329_g267_i2_p1_GENE_NODE_2253_length_2401_cov_113_348329_g267_i2NODE_2253_length_2401_cov_113_348329_g267_i2_p1_ORF_typecomplete_len260_score18_08_NODE_2253_length_2401_cov_113_348329_g267_i23691148